MTLGATPGSGVLFRGTGDSRNMTGQSFATDENPGG